ncbi:MAG: hypothetical protein AVDCRST_MAG26-113 [uncultured Chloroflexia bacterium]|uniref:Glycerophosphoryl diester phosphodiesterase membrane domain-containing protein n=1 Tax=uncultured Chloroflexia bacterium TaxID=1672391 RepID=A0A6J4H2D7_9CHLR|nr:MAG: hypothetical protein AVDCRST_MAG26-113 [uncultured Chloroflexia bacterium]
MKRSAALPWALALLDDGLRLYRRHLLSFVMIAALVMVPLAAVGLLWTTWVQTQLGGAWIALGAILLAIIQYPLLLVAYAGIARAASMALDRRPIRVRDALRIGPVRVIAMGCYTVLFFLITSICLLGLFLAVVCPLLWGASFGGTMIGALGGSGTIGAAGSFVVVIFGIAFLAVLLLSGAAFASQAYAVQAFALEQRPIGASMSRSVDLLTFRFGRNLLVFMGAGAIVSTLLVAYLGTLFGGGMGLLRFLDVELSPLTTTVLQSVATTATQVLLMPPLSIWMAMLHRALAQERDGQDLVVEVEEWLGRTNDQRPTTATSDA